MTYRCATVLLLEINDCFFDYFKSWYNKFFRTFLELQIKHIFLDLMLWMKWSYIITYAYHTSTSVSGSSLAEVIKRLEEDAGSVLKFMASNGLVANATKTTFLIINSKSKNLNSIRIGDADITQEKTAKLLGVTLSDDLQWNKHIENTINALRRRLFLITRLRNKLNAVSLKRISDSIFNSKIRYGLQLCGKVRIHDSDSKQGFLMNIQKIQNKMFRILNNCSLKDKISTKSIASELKMLSVNQINAQVKLTESWKALNVEKYPNIVSQKVNDDGYMISR